MAGQPALGDPLVLDLAGTGIYLTSQAGSNAFFDYTDSGFRQNTGWITPGEGLLVTAPTDGATVGATNLLGATSGSGFADLASLDSNGDGVVDASDPGFVNLRVWIDSNGDGTSNASELYSLSDLGITSINVVSANSNQLINDNTVTGTSTFTVTNPATGAVTTHAISEVDFQTNRQLSVLPDPVGPNAQAMLLPNLDGYGSLPDLRVAMTLNTDLAGQVQSLVLASGSMTGAEFKSAFENILFTWAGAENIDPTSIGSGIDARHAAVIYAYLGIDPTASTTPIPNSHSGPVIWEPYYEHIFDALEVRFASQIASSLLNLNADPSSILANPYASFAVLGFDPTADTIEGDISTLFSLVGSRQPQDPDAASAYWDKVTPILAALEGDQSLGGGVDQTPKYLVYAFRADFPTSVIEQLGSLHGVSFVSDAGVTGAVAVTSNGAFVLIGDGDKTLSGGAGDTYVYDSTGGDVTISASPGSYGGPNLILSGFYSADLVFTRSSDGNDLIDSISSTSHSITLTNFFSGAGWAGIYLDDKEFPSSSVLQTLMMEAVSYLNTTSDDATSRAAKLATFGFQVQAVNGGVVTASSSKDTVFEISASLINGTIDCDGDGENANILRFTEDVGMADLKVLQSNNGRDLILEIAKTGQSITLLGQGNEGNGHLETINFADGTSISAKDLWSLSISDATNNNLSVVYGDYGANNLTAGAGTVDLHPRSGGATLTTGSGHDRIYAVGSGNTFVVTPDNASVEISDSGGSSANVLKLPDAITEADVTVTQSTNKTDLILTLSSGQVITLDHALSGMFATVGASTVTSIIPAETVQFSDGTSWDWQTLIEKSIATMEALGNDTVFDGDSFGT